MAARLRTAPMEVVGQFSTASNTTLLARLTDVRPAPPPEDTDVQSLEHVEDLCVYKPRRGEAPLWDFPRATLYRREVAAYATSRALGWDCVPVTVAREDAPLGTGSVQRFVAFDPAEHYFTIMEERAEELLDQLQRLCVFDMVVNNADRKGGHVIVDADDHVWGVDHGVTFHHEPKLRTVMWHFAGMELPEDLRADVARLATALEDLDPSTQPLRDLLGPAEVAALAARAGRVSRRTLFPEPTGDRPFPWPML